MDRIERVDEQWIKVKGDDELMSRWMKSWHDDNSDDEWVSNEQKKGIIKKKVEKKDRCTHGKSSVKICIIQWSEPHRKWSAEVCMIYGDSGGYFLLQAQIITG